MMGTTNTATGDALGRRLDDLSRTYQEICEELAEVRTEMSRMCEQLIEIGELLSSRAAS